MIRDAWNEHKGLSKTEAKRRYIPTLIDTMHKYASATPYVLILIFLFTVPLTY